MSILAKCRDRCACDDCLVCGCWDVGEGLRQEGWLVLCDARLCDWEGRGRVRVGMRRVVVGIVRRRDDIKGCSTGSRVFMRRRGLSGVFVSGRFLRNAEGQ